MVIIYANFQLILMIKSENKKKSKEKLRKMIKN